MKKIRLLTAILAVSTIMGISSYAAEWKHDETGYWYVQDDGSSVKSVMKEIDGVTYGFDEQGYMVKGWKNYDGLWYYFDPASGAIVSGWKEIDGKWYYLKPAMAVGWLDLGVNRYYLDRDGILKTGWFSTPDTPYMYRAYADGKLYRNKLDDSEEEKTGKVFRYREDGTILYKSANTSKLDTSWQELLAGEFQEENIANQKDELSDLIEEVKEKNAISFYKKVYPFRRKNSYSEKLSSWETNAKNALSKYGVEEEELKQYFTDVLNGCYDENGNYSEESEEETEEDYEYETVD